MQVDDLIGQLQSFAAGVEHEKTDNRLREAAGQVADELVALQSIFGNDNLTLLSSRSNPGVSDWTPQESIRLCIAVPMDLGDGEGDEDLLIKLSATLPSGYPQTSTAPQLQLLSKYVGPHGVDHSLFGQILRIFYHGGGADDYAVFQQGEVALFEGIERVREKVEAWYSEKEAEKLQRKEEEDRCLVNTEQEDLYHRAEEQMEVPARNLEPNGFNIYSSPAITERKSVFVGHAALLTDPSQVAVILEAIIKDKKVARATHPTIHAWVCRPKADGPVYRDCDDDGETAAGGRLAHLLDLLHLENVIVVVTRWYGGVHLGADRFKLINRAAREALEVAQLVTGSLNSTSSNSKNGQNSKR